MKVAITGVSGHLGTLIAKHVLRRSPNAIVHGICRSPEKLPEQLKSNDRFKVFKTSHDDAQKLRSAISGTDIAIFATLAYPVTMREGQKAVIEACIDENVPRYMAGDWSLDFRPIKLGDLPPKDPMKDVAAYLDKRESETGGKLKGVHVLNGAFMEIIGRGFLNGKTGTINVWGNGDDKWDLTTYNDAANFSAAIALDPTATGWFNGESKPSLDGLDHDQLANLHVSVRGDRAGANDIARYYKEAFGTDLKRVEHGSLDDLYKTMHQVRKQQPDNIWAWMGLFYTYYSSNGDGALREPLHNAKYDELTTTSVLEYFQAIKQPEKIGMPFDQTQ